MVQHRSSRAPVLRRVIVLAALTALALAIRLWRLRGDPLYGDEAEYAIVARSLSEHWLALDYPQLQGFERKPFVSQPPLLLYAMAAFMRAMGPVDLAAQLPSVLLGAATVPVVYLLASRLGGSVAGAAAGLLLAVHPFHVELSRHAMLDAAYVFFLVSSVLLLVRWLDTRRAAWLVGASAAATLSALTKLPGVLACVVVALVVAGALAVHLARREWRPAARVAWHGALSLVPPALGAGAYLALLLRIGALDDLGRKLLWQASRVQGAGGADPMRVNRPLSFYLLDPHDSLPALLGIIVLACALLGAIVVSRDAWRERAARRAALPVLASVAILGAFFAASGRKEGFYLLPFVPFAAILSGAACAAAPRMASSWRATRPHASVAVAALFVVPVYAEAADWYERLGPGHDPAQASMGEAIRDAALVVRAHSDGAGVYGTLLGRYSLYWYTGLPTYHWYLEEAQLEEEIAAGRLAFFVYDDYLDLPHERETIERIVARHDARVIARLPDAAPRITVYEVSLEAPT